MSIKVLTIILSSLVFFFVLELIREEKLTFKYAIGWLGISLAAVVLTVFDPVLFQAAAFLGFELTSNFIFFGLLSLLVFWSLLLTVFLCQQNSRNDVMAQKIGTLELEVKELKRGSPSTPRSP